MKQSTGLVLGLLVISGGCVAEIPLGEGDSSTSGSSSGPEASSSSGSSSTGGSSATGDETDGHVDTTVGHEPLLPNGPIEDPEAWSAMWAEQRCAGYIDCGCSAWTDGLDDYDACVERFTEAWIERFLAAQLFALTVSESCLQAQLDLLDLDCSETSPPGSLEDTYEAETCAFFLGTGQKGDTCGGEGDEFWGRGSEL